MFNKLSRELAIRNQKGQGLVEYALILVFLALVVVVAVTVFGTIVNKYFTNTNSALSSPP